MPRQLRFLVLSTALAMSVAPIGRAAAEESRPSITDTATTYTLNLPTDSSFLVARMTPRTENAATTASGSSHHDGFGIGVKGGVLFSSFSNARADFDNNAGWQLGIFFGGNRGGVLGVMGEILYGKTNLPGPVAGTAEQFFLEIPILMRLNIGSNSLNGVSFYGLVGPVFDVNLKTEQNNLNVKDNYNSLDIGLIAGGGVEITRFFVEARYNWGFKNVLQTNSSITNVQDLNTRRFAAMVGFRFN